MRPLLAIVLSLVAGLYATPAAAGDIADYFAIYYRQVVAGPHYAGPLDFLRDAAAAKKRPQEALAATVSRSAVIDRRAGYLRIDDSSDTDQILTMALYRKADGGMLLFVGSSNCADACDFSAEVFVPAGDRLKALAFDRAVPAVAPAEFIKPGQAMPKALAGAAPEVDCVPDRAARRLTLKPWYGYETEEQMDAATRSAIRNVVLFWDRAQGRFVKR